MLVIILIRIVEAVENVRILRWQDRFLDTYRPQSRCILLYLLRVNRAGVLRRKGGVQEWSLFKSLFHYLSCRRMEEPKEIRLTAKLFANVVELHVQCTSNIHTWNPYSVKIVIFALRYLAFRCLQIVRRSINKNHSSGTALYSCIVHRHARGTNSVYPRAMKDTSLELIHEYKLTLYIVYITTIFFFFLTLNP